MRKFKFSCLEPEKMIKSPVGVGDLHMKGVGMLVVLLRGLFFRFWSHLGFPGENSIIYSP